MQDHREGEHENSLSVTRRRVLQYGALLSAVCGPWLKTTSSLAAAASNPTSFPEFKLRRDRDELFLRVTAVGYQDTGDGRLRPLKSAKERFLIFNCGPQHFVETALQPTDIPAAFQEGDLSKIELSPSADSTIVFRIPHRHSLRLSLDELLAWHNFDLVLPDLDKVGNKYDLEIPRTSPSLFTRIEMPWGIELSPASSSSKFVFTDPLRLRVTGTWSELWTTALVEKATKDRETPLQLEVLSARGFERTNTTGSVDQGDLLVTYRNRPTESFPSPPVPISNYSRMDIAASLSRRFPYTGLIGPPPVESGKLAYTNESTCIAACFAPGRTVTAKQLRLSARGGWLHLEGKWNPFPGCALSGWVHSASLGRDDHVEVVSEGFLYPFGTPCELIIQSDRVFAKDQDGHYVAPLIKQAFLQIPQPNSTTVGHPESPFVSISITTERSPPLDVPPGGDVDIYRKYDFFMPLVKGVPFSFEHVGHGWNDAEHRSSMPMFFVSNKARLANGLLWEPGYAWSPPADPPSCYPSQPGSPDAAHIIMKSGEGLRVVDKAWALQPGRFAQYNGALIALGPSAAGGNTAQKVDWIEWTRANIPDLAPKTIQAPFRPRARTMRIRVQATSQLSGEPSASIVTYRDVRFATSPFLDPEPTTPASQYFENVTCDREDPDTPYLYTLETRALVSENGPVTARAPNKIAEDIRENYYAVSVATSPIPIALFLGVDNEIRFGNSASSDGVGGLSVPDTHASTLTRKVGVLGDATFNERRWPGYNGQIKARIQNTQRLDYAAFGRAREKLDKQPFDKSRDPDRRKTIDAARTLMGLPLAVPLLTAAHGTPSPALKLGDMFGADAQVIPGLSFAKIFEDIVLADNSDDPDARAATPLVWHVQLTGIEWLTALLNTDASSVSLPDVIAALLTEAAPNPITKPLSMGVEATLHWSNDAFKEVDVGPAVFIPKDNTKLVIDASSRLDLGVVVIPPNASEFSFAPGKPHISAAAKITDFSVKVFGTILVNFSAVAFEITEDGHKNFTCDLDSVELLPPLDFINQIASIFGGLGDDQGIKIEPSPRQIQISQTLRFPDDDEPLFMGPAMITNLSLSWFVTIPLIGRDVLAVGFGVSSREKPLTIWVPPYYGGKSYALIEAATKGLRLLEVSMEFGALIPITWGIATGQASITAGICFSLMRDDQHNSGTTSLRAFVKACADLMVAGIIQFNGLILIALTAETGGSGDRISGTATVSVSIKIGFFRVTYSFTAERHEDKSSGSAVVALMSEQSSVRTELLNDNVKGASKTRRARATPPSELRPFGPTFSKQRRAAFVRVLAGYR